MGKKNYSSKNGHDTFTETLIHQTLKQLLELGKPNYVRRH